MAMSHAKPSLLTLPPAALDEVFRFLKVWNSIRCATANAILLESRKNIVVLWRRNTYFQVWSCNYRLERKMKVGVLLLWKFAMVLIWRRRFEATGIDDPRTIPQWRWLVKTFLARPIPHVLNSPAQALEHLFPYSMENRPRLGTVEEFEFIEIVNEFE